MARGATFNTALEEKVGEVIGKELVAVGGNAFGGKPFDKYICLQP
jgi:beta-glucosidase